MKKVDLARWERYFDARDSGLSVEKSAAKARISPSTAWRFERGDQRLGASGFEAAATLGRLTVGGAVVLQPLSEQARAALDDFGLFRRRYFGRVSKPWQERAAYEVLRRMESEDREYIVMNEPPGSGKSTLFTHDIPCWIIARDRTKRIMIGSRTERQARMYVGRIKRSLEREVPLAADADQFARGFAFDAEATLADDFGVFKPDGRGDLWRAEGLVVRQLDGVGLDDKEATVSAWGMDSGFLGGRYDLVVWDDLVDRKNSKTSEQRESLAELYDTEMESRLEPGGVLLLQGQRITANDLYRHALDKKTLDEEPKYAHVKYPAHDDERCEGIHDASALPWPEGCLLDPQRLPWKHLQTLKHNNPRTYEVMYQQKDGDTVGGLVDPAWIEGGTDSEGYPAPGCLDRDRVAGVVPANLTDGRGWSFVTVDPSPTQWWGVIWWVYDPASNNRYAIRVIRRRMNPEDFLSLDLTTFAYSGLMVDLHREAITAGAPIQLVVVEINAAQRWLLQQPHVQAWTDATGVVFMPHSTGVNKADPKFGFESIGDLFRQGFNRFPYGDPSSRFQTQALVTEAVQYPDGDTDDLLMSTWFQKLAIENHYVPQGGLHYRMPRPGYVTKTGRGAPVRRGLSYAR